MAERRCGSCRFWGFLRETEPHVEIGECRRHAPEPIRDLWAPGGRDQSTPYRRAYWRLTMFDDWCGEHMPKIKGGE